MRTPREKRKTPCVSVRNDLIKRGGAVWCNCCGDWVWRNGRAERP